MAMGELLRHASPDVVAMRRQESAVESVIKVLKHRGLERILTYGATSIECVMTLADVAFTPHRSTASPPVATTMLCLTRIHHHGE